MKSARWFFKNFPREKILELEVNCDNPRAYRCYEKSGFKKIKRKHYKKHHDSWLMRLEK